MYDKPIILIKAIKELNIGMGTAVEAFAEVGVIIEKSPMTKLTGDQYRFLIEKYHGKKISTEISPFIKQKIETITSFKLLERNRENKKKITTVFKYFNINYGLDCLEEMYLFYSKYENFNDPFDCSLDLLDFGYKKIVYNSKREELANLMGEIGVCCFSGNNNSILMWSHYAENHKGFCIEFHTGKSEHGINPLEVVYKKSFVKANFIKDGKDAIAHVIYSKAKDWAYEDELRSIITHIVNPNLRKKPFKLSDVKAIYLGVKCTNETKIKILLK